MPYVFTQTAPKFIDPLHHRVYDELRRWTQWLNLNGVNGYLGEVGWPNQNPANDRSGGPYNDSAKWNRLGEAWYKQADKAGLWVTHWCVSSKHPSEIIWLDLYQTVDDSTRDISVQLSSAPVVEAHADPAIALYRRGVNHSGAELEQPGFSNTNPGTYGDWMWFYPTQNTINYLYARGHRLLRLPFRWERIQPTLGAALSSTEVTRINTVLGYVAAAGTGNMKVVLDCHNYASYYTTVSGSQVESKLGGSGLSVANFTDLWTRMVSSFNSHSALLGYGLMNEPYGISGASDFAQAKNWESYSQSALTAIRSAGSTKTVLVPGYFSVFGNSWAYLHPASWITDSASNFRYEQHQYFSWAGGGGAYAASYSAEVAAARAAGY